MLAEREEDATALKFLGLPLGTGYRREKLKRDIELVLNTYHPRAL